MIRRLSITALVVAMLAPLSAFQSPYRPGNGVTTPVIVSRVQPNYTQEAKAAKVEGTVVLRLVVDRSGAPHDIEVTKPLEPGLDANAITALSQWLFKPGMKDGQPVDVIASIEINFKLL